MVLKFITISQTNYLCFVVIIACVRKAISLNCPFNNHCIEQIVGIEKIIRLFLLYRFLSPKSMKNVARFYPAE